MRCATTINKFAAHCADTRAIPSSTLHVNIQMLSIAVCSPERRWGSRLHQLNMKGMSSWATQEAELFPWHFSTIGRDSKPWCWSCPEWQAGSFCAPQVAALQPHASLGLPAACCPAQLLPVFSAYHLCCLLHPVLFMVVWWSVHFSPIRVCCVFC